MTLPIHLRLHAPVQPAKAGDRPSAPISRRSRPVRRRIPPIDAMRVEPRKNGWALMVDGLDEPAWIVSTKKRAVTAAKDAAAFHKSVLRVLTRAGTVQRVHDFSVAS